MWLSLYIISDFIQLAMPDQAQYIDIENYFLVYSSASEKTRVSLQIKQEHKLLAKYGRIKPPFIDQVHFRDVPIKRCIFNTVLTNYH